MIDFLHIAHTASNHSLLGDWTATIAIPCCESCVSVLTTFLLAQLWRTNERDQLTHANEEQATESCQSLVALSRCLTKHLQDKAFCLKQRRTVFASPRIYTDSIVHSPWASRHFQHHHRNKHGKHSTPEPRPKNRKSPLRPKSNSRHPRHRVTSTRTRSTPPAQRHTI